MGKALHLEEKISKDELFDLYILQNKTTEDIGKIYNTSKYSIFRLLKKYNIEKPKELRIQSSKNKILDKYGVDNVFRTAEIKEKIKQTNLEKYGVENPSSLKEIKEKRTKTINDKYGVDNVFQLDEIKEKSKKTNLEKYGNEYASKSDIVRNKIKSTMTDKYGFPFPKQTNEIVNKNFKDKESATEFIKNNYLNKTAHQISDSIGISYPQLLRYIRKYNLQEYIDFNTNQSFGETKILDYLKDELHIVNIEEHNRTILGDGKEIDIYLPDYKLGIEINGMYFHSDIFKEKNYHKNKSLICESNGIHLMHIYEWEITDNNMLEKIKSILRIFTNNVKNRIYARKCEIREITNAEAKIFNDKNHLQNHRNAKITYGLFYNNELVQLMSFSKHSIYEWEIIRGCPGSNNVVIGGVSKLFKHFIKENNPNQIFSYCDFNKFDGHGYEAIGMKCIGYTAPDKNYIFNHIRKCRNGNRYKEYSENATCIVYGAGSKKYLWKKDED